MKMIQKRPIRRRSLHAEAVHELREMIIGGKLQPGDRLVESELCELFDISRTPLREAIKVLDKEGLIDLRPNRGARVSEISPVELTELFEFVSNLERIAVELAIERMEDKSLSRLRKMHDKMITLFKRDQRRECFQMDFELHNYIVSLSGNSILQETHQNLMTRTRRGRYMALFSQVRWDEAMAEHEDLMEAIERKDSDLAGKLMRSHVTKTGVVVRQSIAPDEENLEKERRRAFA